MFFLFFFNKALNITNLLYLLIGLIPIIAGLKSKRTLKNADKRSIMSDRTDEELVEIYNDFKNTSFYNRCIQEYSSSNNDDIKLTPKDLVELVNYTSALEELKKRGMYKDKIPSFPTLIMSPADENDDSDFNKTK